MEAKLYKLLQGEEGFPKLYFFGIEGEYTIIILELLGPSLEELLSICGQKFSLPTTLAIGEQMVQLLD